nr:MAG TPA: hypothetical protein [Caudoviricetes sp.]
MWQILNRLDISLKSVKEKEKQLLVIIGNILIKIKHKGE